jgi:hypothetical protein
MDRIPKGTKVRDQFGNVGELTDDYVGKSTAWIRVAGKRTEAHSSKVFLMDGRSLTEAIGANRDLMSKQPNTEGLAELLSASSSPAERAILMQRAAPKVAMAGKEWGLRWKEWNAKGQLVTKEKFFATDEARTKFIEKVEQNDNFHMVESFSDPRTGMHAGQPQVAMAINPEDQEQIRHSQQQMQARKELTKALDALKGTLRGIDTAMKHDDMREVAREIQRLGGQVDAIDRAMVRVDY